MDTEEILQIFNPLYSDLVTESQFPNTKPLLAHYTSINVLEAILRNDEIWFSNPLYMNDLQEVRFGINEGTTRFLSSTEIEEACGDRSRFDILKEAFNHYFNVFANDHVLDTYVFCLSEHDRENTDGLLSMWRGYGGQGSGASIVFDTASINANDASPLIIAKVDYASTEKRIEWIDRRIKNFAHLLASAKLPTEKLFLSAFAFFERLKLFAIFTKHSGFAEEREWRVVYMRSRDTSQKLDHLIDYWIGPRGVEPKLKFPIKHIPDLTQPDLSLLKIVHRIILGPSISTPLAKATISKMFDRLNKSDLKAWLISSTIPFRM